MHAVNLADLTNRKARLAWLLIGPVAGEIVDAEPHVFAGAAVVLACDDERAQAIVDVLRVGLNRYELRCYKCRGKTWKRI